MSASESERFIFASESERFIFASESESEKSLLSSASDDQECFTIMVSFHTFDANPGSKNGKTWK